MPKKIALLVGISEYSSELSKLPSATKDAEAMKLVLQNPKIGGFNEADVTLLLNPEKQQISEAISHLFANCHQDDLVLFYFSGHGIKDEKGNLYLVASDTRKQKGKLIPLTALSSKDVHTQMENSKCKRQIVILDCCFSGAFPKGMRIKGDETVDLNQLSGIGRAILTSSNTLQYSLAPEGSELSVYSRYLVEGLKTGAGDLDGDGKISVYELHEYARKKVLEVYPDDMKPEIYSLSLDTSRIFLALSPKEYIRLKYRKEVEVIAREDNGEIQFINRQTLNQIRKTLGLSN
ncbi:MAG: hypothetical protein F6K26_42510, partial [Moorea sp. SIO2I5]|nr:hypothetical protein [Moorena sp. SIO2I5]